MADNYWAHSANGAGQPHSLKKHLLGVACLAYGSGVDKNTQTSCYLAGLWHDLGKYLIKFQAYLKNGGDRGSVRHALWGAILARLLGLEEVSRAILGHHAGLCDTDDWKANTRLGKFSPQPLQEQLQELVNIFLADTGLSEAEITDNKVKYDQPKRRRDVLTRFIFSALTDADWLDTEAHFDQSKHSRRPPPTLNLDEAIKKVETTLATLADESKPINRLRDKAREDALEKAALPPGFFSLNLPTGLGKTLTSFCWALAHAQANRLKRIIIVLPYVNIIDQTAERLKDILGPEMVLEHHSSYQPAHGEISRARAEQEAIKNLAAENWDYPIIVTTTVQFYETLFSHSPWKCRKLHNIAEAVVILDEVQTLRRNLTLPTLDMLTDLQNVLRTSFVLCTATMPDFRRREKFPGLEHITELIDNAEEIFKQTRRVKFNFLNNLEPMPFESLISEIEQSSQSALVIVNTKPLARRIFETLRKSESWEKIYHLSTNMCPSHRKDIIKTVETDLKKGEKILLISTQLVEAGVDFDFPVVFRELAPLEAVIQAAGRCNREGLLANGPGQACLFQLADAKFPPDGDYKTLTGHLRQLLKPGIDKLNEYEFFAAYYRQTMALYNTSAPIKRESFNFKTISRQYRLIDEESKSVLVWQYNDLSRALYAKLADKNRHGLKLSRDDYRAAQPYCVNLLPSVMSKTLGLWEELSSGLLVWNGQYDNALGLDYDQSHMPTYDF